MHITPRRLSWRCAALIALLPALAHASPAAHLSVDGLIRPAACAITLGDGGKVPLGTLSRHELHTDRRTLLPERKLPFQISCDAPAPLGLAVRDNRSEGVIPEVSLKDRKFLFGLNRLGDKAVGSYTLYVEDDDLHVDGQPGRVIHVEEDSAWMAHGHFLSPLRLHAVAQAGHANLPAVASAINGTIAVSVSIVPARDLPREDDIPLEGSATFELQYL